MPVETGAVFCAGKNALGSGRAMERQAYILMAGRATSMGSPGVGPDNLAQGKERIFWILETRKKILGHMTLTERFCSMQASIT